MIEAIKRFAEASGDGNSKEEKDLKIKISVDSLKYPLKSNGEIMLEHQIEEILTDSDLVFEDSILIDEFAKYLMSR